MKCMNIGTLKLGSQVHKSLQCFLNSSSKMGHNNLILKLTICANTTMSMSHFTFAVTQRISKQSQNTEDQSTSGSHWSGRFCGLDEEWTQFLTSRSASGKGNLHYWREHLRMWHPPSQYPYWQAYLKTTEIDQSAAQQGGSGVFICVCREMTNS